MIQPNHVCIALDLRHSLPDSNISFTPDLLPRALGSATATTNHNQATATHGTANQRPREGLQKKTFKAARLSGPADAPKLFDECFNADDFPPAVRVRHAD